MQEELLNNICLKIQKLNLEKLKKIDNLIDNEIIDDKFYNKIKNRYEYIDKIKNVDNKVINEIMRNYNLYSKFIEEGCFHNEAIGYASGYRRSKAKNVVNVGSNRANYRNKVKRSIELVEFFEKYKICEQDLELLDFSLSYVSRLSSDEWKKWKDQLFINVYTVGGT